MFSMVILALGSTLTVAQQKPRSEPQRQEVQLGRGMSFIAPALMQIGSETNFFLLVADQIRLTEEQRTTLEEIVFEFQKYSVQKLADLNVAEAELERLLTRDKIDLDAVRAKVKEIEAINTDVKMQKIESLLKAINTLTHEQHLKIVTLVRELPSPGRRPQLERAAVK
jgi:Spy/CpxP family protein refolding chaperone